MVELKDHFVFVKDVTVAPSLSPVFGQFLHDLQLMLDLLHLHQTQLLLLHQFGFIYLAIDNVLSLLIRQLCYTFDHCLLEPRRDDLPVLADCEEDTEG